MRLLASGEESPLAVPPAFHRLRSVEDYSPDLLSQTPLQIESTKISTYPYLDTLPLSTKQKETITEAGYENAPTLYMMCKVIPTAMKEVLEVEGLDELEAALWEKLSAEERTAIEAELEELKKL